MTYRRFSSRRSRMSMLLAAALSTGAALASCVNDAPSDPAGGDASVNAQYLIGNLSAQREAVNVRQVARTFAEYLPDQMFIVGGAPAKPESVGVVFGRIVEATGAKGFRILGEGPTADAPGGTETDFDDPRAQWRVIDATIEVIDAVGIEVTDEIHVGITADGPDTKALLSGTESLGEVVVVLEGRGFHKFDNDLYTIDGFNSLLGTVNADGQIQFDVLGPDSENFVGDLTTWAAVKTEFERKNPPISTDTTGRRLTD